MKIAIYSDHFYPELGGIQDSFLAQAIWLQQQGHTIHIIVPKYSKLNYSTVRHSIKELCLHEGITIHRIPSIPFPSSTLQSRIVLPSTFRNNLLESIRPDIIHSHTFFGLGIEAMLLSKRLQIPLIGTNHMNIRGFIPRRISSIRLIGDTITSWITQYYNHADFVTAPAQFLLDEMVEQGLTIPSRVIANPVDIDIFEPVSQSKKATLKKKLVFNGPTIIYAGRLGKEKNVDDTIKAVKLLTNQIPNIVCAIAGHGNERATLVELSAQLGITSNIRFLGTLGKTELAEAFAAADLFVMSSISEVQSLSVMQAMACGLPVVGVNAGGLPEYIPKGTGYVVESHDINQLAFYIARILLRKKQHEGMRNNSSEYAKKFSIHNIGMQWEKLYEKIANLSSKPRL